MAEEPITNHADPTDGAPLPSDERAMRLAKRQAMIDAGEEAYKRRFDQTHHAAELAGR